MVFIEKVFGVPIRVELKGAVAADGEAMGRRVLG